MEEENNIQNFSAADIERYHKGLMHPKEMHALEKAAMDDPFLADALAGYSSAGVPVAADINDLQNRLVQRTGSGKMMAMNVKSGFKWMRVAAMFVVMAGAGMLAYTLLNKKGQENRLAATTEKKQTDTNTEQRVAGRADTLPLKKSDLAFLSDSIHLNGTASSAYRVDSSQYYFYSNIDSAIKQGNSDFTATIQADSIKITSRAFANTTKYFGKEITAAPASPNAAISSGSENKQADVKEKAESKATVADAKKSEAAVEERNKGIVDGRKIAANADNDGVDDKFYQKTNQANSNPAAYKFKSDNTGNRDTTNYRGLNVFRGRVTDGYNNGISFANVTVGAVNVGTYADANGYFNLVAPDSVLNVQLRAIGFNNSQVQLRNLQSGNQIVLQEDRSIPVTVLGEKMPNASRSRSAVMTLTEPEPDDGWEKYDSYLANNLQVPELKKDEIEKKGKQVELSFDVNSKGEPVNIKVTKSLCKECDEEAVRLVQEGPRWKKKNKKGKAKVTIVF